MTFEEWWEEDPLYNLHPDDDEASRKFRKYLKDNMRRAWDARYETLTYKDL